MDRTAAYIAAMMHRSKSWADRNMNCKISQIEP